VSVICPERVSQMAATLDLENAPRTRERLPPGWHWLFFNPAARASELGADGHPKRGGFLPPVPLPRRMWAGGRLSFHAPLRVGEPAERESEILKIDVKSGKRGALTFVTVRHLLSARGALAIEEEQDIVYREASPPGSPAPTPQPAPEGAEWSREIRPDPTLLFRYSALTFNGHRIHYDRPYATEVEGYQDLVVHGPLTATLLMQFAGECRPGRDLSRFQFRGVHPLFVTMPFTLQGKEEQAPPSTIALWARSPAGELAMSASAQFA
jgi:3-methylfumaryl-CoA hydratase